MKKRIITCLIVLLLVGSLTVSAHEVPDLTQKGSIVFCMDWEGVPLNGGTLTMYRVGDIVEDDGDYSFAAVSGLKNPVPDDLNDPALAASMVAAAENAGLEPITVSVENGEAVFTDVAPGLYVVIQKKAAEGFSPLSPFFISMPQFRDGRYEYDIAADPKVSPEPEPADPTKPTQPKPTEPKPPVPSLPQTGQLNWPVPILAAAGFGLFLTGGILCSGRKKEKHEN